MLKITIELLKLKKENKKLRKSNEQLKLLCLQSPGKLVGCANCIHGLLSCDKDPMKTICEYTQKKYCSFFERKN